jgi:putative redox protein
MVKIELERLDKDFLMQAKNDRGNLIQLDASPQDGGQGKGFGPMQVLLAGMGGCSAIDVVTILRKQREPLEDIKITIEGEREPGAVPSLYQTVHAHFKLYGNLNPDKVQKAVALSVEKYCSVAKTLEKSAKITHSFEIIAP